MRVFKSQTVTLPLFEWRARVHEWQTSWRNFTTNYPYTYLLFKIGMGLGLLIFLLISLFVVSISMGAFGKVPTQRDLVRVNHQLGSEVFANDGSLLGRYYLENRATVEYTDISPHFINALVATEDARFFSHAGVDFRSWGRVFFKTILMDNAASGGGSTISQQLAKNLYPRQDYEYASLVINKLKEVIIAMRLENLYTKEEILELYLNTVPFSENTYGIQVASRRFFSTTPGQLKPEQAAVLVAMLKATSTYNPVTRPERSTTRRNLVLGQMSRYGYLTEAEKDSLQGLPLQLKYSPIHHNAGMATYFREHLRIELRDALKDLRKPNGMAYNLYTDGLKIFTTLDGRLQQYAEEAVQEHLNQLQKDFVNHLEGADPWENDTILLLAVENSVRYRSMISMGFNDCQIDSVFEKPVSMTVFDWDGCQRKTKMSPMDSIKYYLGFLNAGFLAIDPETGAVKAWVGGIDHEYFQYDHVKSRRQVGSTFKPLVYTNAIQKGIAPCSYTGNYLRSYPRYNYWTPKNADNKYGGSYSMEGGLINSVNTISVSMAMRGGPKDIAKLAMDMGISGPVLGVPAIALGAVEASLLDMVTVYGTFAGRGVRPNVHYIDRIETADGQVLVDFTEQKSNGKRVLQEDEADMITAMLKTAVNRGTGQRLRWKYKLENELAGKTGTSQNHSDGWFIGYNSKLVAGVWVGAESPAVRFRNLRLGQGANTALPVFGLFTQKLNKDESLVAYREAKFPKASANVQAALSCPNIIWPGSPPTEPGETPATEPVASQEQRDQPAPTAPSVPVADEPVAALQPQEN
ncbi:MAG: transglycosylase domain-containing protein [Bacteroidota bacterium]